MDRAVLYQSPPASPELPGQSSEGLAKSVSLLGLIIVHRASCAADSIWKPCTWIGISLFICLG